MKCLNLYRSGEFINFSTMDCLTNEWKYWIRIRIPRTTYHHFFEISVTYCSRESTVDFFFSYYTQQDYDKIFGSNIETKKQVMLDISRMVGV